MMEKIIEFFCVSGDHSGHCVAAKAALTHAIALTGLVANKAKEVNEQINNGELKEAV